MLVTFSGEHDLLPLISCLTDEGHVFQKTSSTSTTAQSATLEELEKRELGTLFVHSTRSPSTSRWTKKKKTLLNRLVQCFIGLKKERSANTIAIDRMPDKS